VQTSTGILHIGFDVMGGDFAPQAAIAGAVQARDILPSPYRILLIGDKDVIHSELQKAGSDASGFDIHHAPEVIEMGEQPTRAYSTKLNSSIVQGFQLLKGKEIIAFASAGNTGAMVVGSIYTINPIPGIIRPCTLAVIPKESGGVNILLDVGTNPDPKPDVMYQFAILGSVYAKYVFGIDKPRIGLLNIGEEDEKGNILTQASFRLMNDSNDFNFVGNVESREIFRDKTDVIVCDGFTGNVVLKQLEATYRMLVKRGLTDDFIHRFNYELYGGTPVLGVNSAVILGHGISNPTAFKNMILQAKNVYEAKLSSRIKSAMKLFSQQTRFIQQ
jgi:glycerol-3-phosphate acyltransferase PlsX